jgi:hypothetical protein
MLDFDNGKIADSKLKTLAYCCNILTGIIKESELEERIVKLERRADNEHN